MAYRRRQQTTHNTAIQSYRTQHEDNDTDVDFAVTGTNPNSSTSLAAKAIRASSAAHRDSSLSSAYGGFSIPSSTTSVSSFQNYGTNPPSGSASTEEPKGYEYTSIKNLNDGKQGFWSSLARKAKSILDDDDDVPGSPQYADSTARNGPQIPHTAAKSTNQNVYPSNEGYRRSDRPTLRKGLNAISSSLSYIGNAVEEGLTVVENRTADIIQETRKHIRIKPSTAVARNQGTTRSSTWQQPQGRGQMQPPAQSDLELQLKASRDVAMAMAAKAKLLLRELKTVKADLAFAKERCAQLEDENKILRDNRGRGENSEDDDLIRLQLETLLAEKARLAHENSVYARENRFLREIVEYHQLTMQDVVYLDEGTEEVTEVYPIKVVSSSQPTEASFDKNLEMGLENPPRPVPPPGVCDFTQSNTQPK